MITTHHFTQKARYGFIGISVMLVALFILNLLVGSVFIPLHDLKMAFFFPAQADETIVHIIFKSRLPQAVTALLAGAALAVTGLQLQTIFRNPLADPSILGISAGASLGVALVVMVAGSIGGVIMSSLGIVGHLAITIMAFGGSFLVLIIILQLSRTLNNNAVLLIAGIMIGYASGAFIDILKFFSPKEDIHAYVIWGMGSFSNVTQSQLIYFVPVVLLGLMWSLFMIKPLNIMLLGDNYSSNLGLNIRLTRFLILANTGLLTAIITAFCGPIAFIGLAVPHLTRSVIRTSNHAVLLPGVMIAGATLALFCSFASRMPGIDGTLPVNSVTAIIGAPVVLWVLIKKRREVGL